MKNYRSRIPHLVFSSFLSFAPIALSSEDLSPDRIFQDASYIPNEKRENGFIQNGGYSSYFGESGSGLVYRSYRVKKGQLDGQSLVDLFSKRLLDLGFKPKEILSGKGNSHKKSKALEYENPSGDVRVILQMRESEATKEEIEIELTLIQFSETERSD